MGPNGKNAGFDEIVMSKRWERFRGTGVLLRGGDGTWKIAHYSLTALVPNERFAEVATKGLDARAANKTNEGN
ncbi:MAG: hypothetical protein ACI8RN_002642 [Glaciecola sp.]|jgi:hypothetical protein